MWRHYARRLGAQSFYPIHGFLQQLRASGANVMINDSIKNPEDLNVALRKAEQRLDQLDPEVRCHSLRNCPGSCMTAALTMRWAVQDTSQHVSMLTLTSGSNHELLM